MDNEEYEMALMGLEALIAEKNKRIAEQQSTIARLRYNIGSLCDTLKLPEATKAELLGDKPTDAWSRDDRRKIAMMCE